MEAVPVHSGINKLRIGHRHFYRSYGVKGKDNRHTIPFPLGKGWTLVTDSFGAVGGGGRGNTESELSCWIKLPWLSVPLLFPVLEP